MNAHIRLMMGRRHRSRQAYRDLTLLDLDLTVRAHNVLKASPFFRGLPTVGEIIDYMMQEKDWIGTGPQRLLRLRNCGPKTAEIIVKALREVGVPEVFLIDEQIREEWSA